MLEFIDSPLLGSKSICERTVYAEKLRPRLAGAHRMRFTLYLLLAAFRKVTAWPFARQLEHTIRLPESAPLIELASHPQDTLAPLRDSPKGTAKTKQRHVPSDRDQRLQSTLTCFMLGVFITEAFGLSGGISSIHNTIQ